jgi:hypothetical protein
MYASCFCQNHQHYHMCNAMSMGGSTRYGHFRHHEEPHGNAGRILCHMAALWRCVMTAEQVGAHWPCRRLVVRLCCS